MSSRETVVFLNTGSISAKCWHRFSGTRMSHSTSPNSVPAQTASNICCRVSCHLTPRRRRNSMSRNSFTAGALIVLFHVHSHISITYTKRRRYAVFLRVSSKRRVIDFPLTVFTCAGASVKETPVELIRCSSFVTLTIHMELSYALLPAVKLVSEGVSGSRCFPS